MTKNKSKTKNLLLDCAIDLAIDEGVTSVTLDATAKRADMSKGGILYHFPTRYALIEGMLLRTIDELKSEVNRQRENLTDQDNPTLRALIKTCRRRIVSHEKQRVTMVTSLMEDRKILEHARRELSEMWLRIKEETSDEIGAQVIWMSLEGVHFLNLMQINFMDVYEDPAFLERLEKMIDELPGKATNE